MNIKKILALAAVAVATVASASTNYVEVATKTRNLYATVRAMGNDRPDGYRSHSAKA